MLAVLATLAATPARADAVQALVVDPATPGTVYAGTADHGVVKTTDGGATWSPAWDAARLGTSDVQILAIARSAPRTIYAGTAAGIFRSDDGGATWTATGPTPGPVVSIAVDPVAPSTVYAVAGEIPAAQRKLVKSTDAGATWTTLIAADSLSPWAILQGIVIDPLVPTTVYVGVGYQTPEMTWGGIIVLTPTSSSTFDSLVLSDCPSLLTIEPRTDAATAPTLYAVVDGTGIFKSADLTDPLRGWNATGLTDWSGVTWVADVVLDPRNPATVYASVSGASPLRKSTDAAATFTDASAGIADRLAPLGLRPGAGVLALDPLAPSTLYVATEGGVLKSSDAGATWNPTGLFQQSALVSLGVSAQGVLGGNALTGTVTVGAPAPAGGLTVSLSSNTAAASVPASVDVPEGATSATFTVTTSPVTENTPTSVIASLGDATRAAGFQVWAPTAVVFVSLDSTQVAGPAAVNGIVNLSGAPAPPEGLTVALFSSAPAAAAVPATITLGAGAGFGRFVVSAGAVAAPTSVTITATLGTSSRSAVLTVYPAPATAVTSIVMNPTSVQGGSASLATVTLNGVPGPTGAVVTYSTSDSSVAPAQGSSQVQSGSTSVTFSVGTNRQTTARTVTVFASFNGTTVYAPLTVTPSPATAATSIVLKPTSVIGGNASTATVTLNGVAGQQGAVVAYSTSDSAVAPARGSVSVPSGSTTVSFSVPTSRVNSTKSVTVFASFNGTTVSAPLTVTRK